MTTRPLDISVREALKVAEDDGGGFVYVHGDDGKPAAIVLTMMRAEMEIPDVTDQDTPERWAHTHIDLEDVVGEHVLTISTYGWSLEHPHACAGALSDCPVTHACERSIIEGGVAGRYRVRVNGANPNLLVFMGPAL